MFMTIGVLPFYLYTDLLWSLYTPVIPHILACSSFSVSYHFSGLFLVLNMWISQIVMRLDLST